MHHPSPVPVVVPDPLEHPHLADIDPGSGIVAIPAAEWSARASRDWRAVENLPAALAACEALVIDYEGGRYARDSMRTFADRVMHAHGRQAERYPTVARARVPSKSVIPVGLYWPVDGVIEPVDAHAWRRLAAWLGRPPQDATRTALGAELQTTAAHHQERRELRHAMATQPHRRPAIAADARHRGYLDLLPAERRP